MDKSKKKTGFKVVVPAHLASERLPRKVLIDIKGKAMLLRVLERCEKAVGRDKLCVVTPDQEILDRVNQWRFQAFRSDHNLPDGLSAIASITPQLNVDYIVNIQGDQPLVPPDLIQALIENLGRNHADVVTPVFKITEIEDLGEYGVAKVVKDLEGWALYFSRNPIPYIRDIPSDQWLEAVPFWGHYGIYGYKRKVILELGDLRESYLEHGEKLEQLRLLQNGLKIFTFETKHRQLAVDTPADLEKVSAFIE